MTEGVIIAIEKNVLQVEIQCREACAGCALKNGCGMHERIGKKISVPVTNENQYKIGQKVGLEINSEGIIISLFFAYILPLLCVLGVLGLTLWLNCNETFAALCSLGVLIPYYLALHFTQIHLAKKVEIVIL